MWPFILKPCKEGGVIPHVNYIKQLHLPKLSACHFPVLKAKLANQCQHHSRQNNCCDHSILNVIASVHEESFLIDVVTIIESNHKVVSHVDIAFEDII